MNLYERYGIDYFEGRQGRKQPYLANKCTFSIYIDEIKKYINLTGKRTLDIGCALGGFVSLCKKKGAYAIGLDISHYALRQASKKNGGQFVQADVSTSMPFGDKTIDVLTMFDIIEHFYDPCPLLSELYRIIKHRGWLFLSTPNPLSFKRIIKGKDWHFDETHVRFYRVYELKNLLAQFDFEIVRVIYFTESRFKWLQFIFGVFNKARLSDYLFVIAQHK